MKAMKQLWMGLAALVMTVSFTACSSDDDGGNNLGGDVTPAVYASDAARYENFGTYGGIKSVELTESGYYLIEGTNGAMSGTRAIKADGFAMGTYTKNGDTYNLEGVGTMTIKHKGGNEYEVTITTDGGQVTLNANKKEDVAKGSGTEFLCRTWVIDHASLTYKPAGKKAFTISGRIPSEMAQELAENKYKLETEEYNDLLENIQGLFDIKNLTFSKAGTYLVTYTHNSDEFLHANWRWFNEGKGILEYYNTVEYYRGEAHHENGQGYVVLSREGNRLVVEEEMEGYADDTEMTFKIVMREAK